MASKVSRSTGSRTRPASACVVRSGAARSAPAGTTWSSTRGIRSDQVRPHLSTVTPGTTSRRNVAGRRLSVTDTVPPEHRPAAHRRRGRRCGDAEPGQGTREPEPGRSRPAPRVPGDAPGWSAGRYPGPVSKQKKSQVMKPSTAALKLDVYLP